MHIYEIASDRTLFRFVSGLQPASTKAQPTTISKSHRPSSGVLPQGHTPGPGPGGQQNSRSFAAALRNLAKQAGPAPQEEEPRASPKNRAPPPLVRGPSPAKVSNRHYRSSSLPLLSFSFPSCFYPSFSFFLLPFFKFTEPVSVNKNITGVSFPFSVSHQPITASTMLSTADKKETTVKQGNVNFFRNDPRTREDQKKFPRCTRLRDPRIPANIAWLPPLPNCWPDPVFNRTGLSIIRPTLHRLSPSIPRPTILITTVSTHRHTFNTLIGNVSRNHSFSREYIFFSPNNKRLVLDHQIRGTVVFGTVWNAETAIISWVTVVSSVRTKIQSGHVTARVPRTHVSRNAREVSETFDAWFDEYCRSSYFENLWSLRNFFSLFISLFYFFYQSCHNSRFRLKLEEEHRLRQAREQAALREEEERRRAARNSAPAAPVPAPAPASADTAGERVAPPPTAFH